MAKLAAFAAVAVLVGGCDAGGEYPRRDPRTLVVARAAGPIALDPLLVIDSESIELAGVLFETYGNA